ncbi:MAG: ABC transporter substrate binding protein [Candidatus Thiodiazotropha sp.]
MLVYSSGFADEAGKVVLLLSDSAEVYRAVANDTMRDILKRCNHALPNCSRVSFESVVADVPNGTPAHDADLLIAFGSKAAVDSSMYGFKGQMILSMIPRQNIAGEVFDRRTDRAVKIFIDQPCERYFELIKAIMPRAVQVGLMLSSSDAAKQKSLLEAASNVGLEMVIREVDSNGQIGEALSELRGSIDVLLALPDSRIHNSRTIPNILTTSYRNHIPVIGFSSSYVKAGAIAAVYTSLEDISHQVSDVAIKALSSAGVEQQDQQAEYFSVSINYDVARSLGIVIRSPEDIKEAMRVKSPE